MKTNDTNTTMQPLADDDLTLANGGIRRNFADVQIRWHCFQCHECGSWYMLQTEYDQMEAEKAAHTKQTGHTWIQHDEKR